MKPIATAVKMPIHGRSCTVYRMICVMAMPANSVTNSASHMPAPARV